MRDANYKLIKLTNNKKLLNMDKPKKLILDYSKWRCGYVAPDTCDNQLGKGAVRLLNAEGFSCCVGQFSIQLGVDEKLLIDRSSPADVYTHINLFNKQILDGRYLDTTLTEDCIIINDDPETTPERKIDLLRKRLLVEDIELEVINKPD